jgi:glycosyltransferase involved in cell wall biosynthesis
MELVSVIITCYNKEKYITETVRSVLSQTYENLEIIIINDGSTDNSSEVIKRIKDHRLRLFEFENGGANRSRNRALKLVNGDLVAFLDGDDIWHKSKIEKQLKLMKECNYDMCFCNYDTIDDSSQINHTFFKVEFLDFSYKILTEKILEGNFILGSASSVIVRKNILDTIGFFDEDLKWGDDWEYWMRIVFATEKITFLDEILTYIRFGIEQVQTTLNHEKRRLDSLFILDKALSNFDLTCNQKALIHIAKCKVHYSYKSGYFSLLFSFKEALKNNVLIIGRVDVCFLLLKYPVKLILKKTW